MREDEIQILGSAPEKKRLVRRAVLFVVLVAGALLLGLLALRIFLNDKGEQSTTIDKPLQSYVDSVLVDEMKMVQAMWGQAIVMEVATGEVKAMVNVQRKLGGKYVDVEDFGRQLEPGSIVMPSMLLAVLEIAGGKMTDVVDTYGGVAPIDGILIKDHNWEKGGYGEITLDEALRFNSNIAVAKVVSSAFKGKEHDFFKQLQKMGMGQPDSIDGLVGMKPMTFTAPADSSWQDYTLAYHAIGYERKMTPLQILTFYNAIANRGTMMKPTLRKGHSEIVKPQIASKDNILAMQQTLRNVVEKGLGKKAATDKVAVAGMMGTCQVEKFESLIEDADYADYHLSFCGYFPADQPKYSIMVSLMKEGIPASGGGMCGPVFRQIVEYMMRYTDVD